MPQRLRRRAQHQRVPQLPRTARVAPRAQPAGGGAGHGHRQRPALRHPSLHVPPEELLLSGPGQGLPDQPVRRADQRGRLARPARRVPGRHRACPHGGGHRQDDPRRRLGPDPRGRLLAGRLQPLRRPAGRDRERPRPAHLRPGPGLRDRAAGHPGGVGRLRRQDGGGVDAGRRQRLGPPRLRRPVRDPLRDQEPELGALPRPGHRVRGQSARSPCSSRARRSSSRPATGTRVRGAPRRCAPRRTPTTTGTSSSPTWCRWCPTPSGSGRWATPSG